jgi:hypothetical protein
MATMAKICHIECGEGDKTPATTLIMMDGETEPACDACVSSVKEMLGTIKFEAIR